MKTKHKYTKSLGWQTRTGSRSKPVDGAAFRLASHPPEFSLLEHPQERHLRFHRESDDPIQEERRAAAASGESKLAHWYVESRTALTGLAVELSSRQTYPTNIGAKTEIPVQEILPRTEVVTMHSEIERQGDGVWRCAPWEQAVVDAAPHDHIVQLYQDQDFLNRAVCQFVGAGLANGAAIILFPTLTHWNAFRARLEGEGVDVTSAQERGQLTVVDANEFLPRLMRDAMPDPRAFADVIGDIFGQARAGGNYQTVRAWGELVDILWERGDVAASMNLEDLFDQLNKKIGIAMFCSYLTDNFNGDVHAHMLPRLGTNHSHLIPVEHYARLEGAVADALRETVGPDEARVVESRLLSQYRPPFNMPRSQALLLALRQFLPAIADPVLQRSRKLYTASGAA